ncbi:MAG TPA: tRNA (adenosine(37)-N6)-threonylcarbamoyltransferase complex dimerization subunit type 1 TsaB [Solirubrobacteraceae bacterium]|nr:tRNA (adenosine(37)-N6)-threonylcarbamoyltransferase complex dimerization subunit type 1 TsaB [Solirubrobacteraceae bacterium]
MKVLGFDTATRATTVAVLDTDGGMAVERRDDPPPGARPRHTTRLLALVAEALEAAGADWTTIDRIAVGVGPGTFTGLRIGVATAHALARARDIELVGVSTLHALARGAAGPDVGGHGTAGRGPAAADDLEAVMAVIDARRGEVFAAGWLTAAVAQPDATPLFAARALAPEALAKSLQADGRAWLAAGDGAVEFRAALEHVGARIPEPDSGLHRVSAIEHCRLALGLRPEPPEGVQPEYLRLPDAEITLRTARP